ncbi:MAG: ATPase domain-containing protein [Planctomycetaceae bacterium]
MSTRHSTGLPQLDEMLGGGLIPGTMTVVMGATGIGKTQFGLSYAHAGKDQEGEPGILFDMTSRGMPRIRMSMRSDYSIGIFGLLRIQISGGSHSM